MTLAEILETEGVVWAKQKLKFIHGKNGTMPRETGDEHLDSAWISDAEYERRLIRGEYDAQNKRCPMGSVINENTGLCSSCICDKKGGR